MKKIILFCSLVCLNACAAAQYQPISYPWLCEKDPNASECHLLGFEVMSNDQAIVKKYAEYLCVDRVESITMNPAKGRALIVCQKN